ncbi:MAG: helix-turn-helix domain-containing protein, partial [Candidatus Margulisiibacteriota bacterium]|nr:helix-turn-helix domain-containing protein [Candidatus Margulisiibacteriota bacterium]
YLQNQPWPGNIRELENSMQRAVIIANGKPITDAILSFKPGQALTQPLLTSGKTESTVFIPQSLNKNEEDFIRQTLDYYNGNIKKTAEKLEVSRTTLYNKFKKYNINI